MLRDLDVNANGRFRNFFEILSSIFTPVLSKVCLMKLKFRYSSIWGSVFVCLKYNFRKLWFCSKGTFRDVKVFTCFSFWLTFASWPSDVMFSHLIFDLNHYLIDTWEKPETKVLTPIFVPVRVVFGHHVWVGLCLWAIELARVMRKIAHFGIGIVWGVIPMSFPVFWINVSGRSLNSYGTSPNLWVQKELVKFRQGTQDTWLRFAKFLREFLGYPHFNLLGDLGDVILG